MSNYHHHSGELAPLDPKLIQAIAINDITPPVVYQPYSTITTQQHTSTAAQHSSSTLAHKHSTAQHWRTIAQALWATPVALVIIIALGFYALRDLITEHWRRR